MTINLDLHYTDPRLVSLYDRDNPRGVDTDFYLQLARDFNAQTIIDLGCGTGLLTRELAIPGRRVIGVDPSSAMLAWARSQPGAEQVEWVAGDARQLGAPSADMVVMTGNMAQVFLEDDDWMDTLQALYGALRPGGTIAFESRNPAAKGWAKWQRQSTYEVIETPFGPMERWLELGPVTHGLVTFEAHNIFKKTGEHLVVKSTLRFRTFDEIVNALQTAGFVIHDVYGEWQQEPFSNNSPLMIFIAQRRDLVADG